MSIPDPKLALEVSVRVAACGVAISALELLACRRQFGRAGVFSLAAVWPLNPQRSLASRADGILGALLPVQFCGAALLAAVGPFSPAGRVALTLTLAAALATRWRRRLGGDGAEQMALLVLGSASLAALPTPGDTRVVLSVWFIAAQLSLSYLTAGVAKAVSPMWRDGSALPAVLDTYGHGHPLAAALLSRHRTLAAVLCRSVILFECSFPVLILGPGWLATTALVVGLSFHVACAVLMGLNSFLWSFPAAYPCVLAAVGLGWSLVP